MVSWKITSSKWEEINIGDTSILYPFSTSSIVPKIWDSGRIVTKMLNFHLSFENTLPQIPLPLRIQVCPKKGIISTILFWGWDLDHQSYSREGSGFLGYHIRLLEEGYVQKIPRFFVDIYLRLGRRCELAARILWWGSNQRLLFVESYQPTWWWKKSHSLELQNRPAKYDKNCEKIWWISILHDFCGPFGTLLLKP